jgi:hypothetical protein
MTIRGPERVGIEVESESNASSWEEPLTLFEAKYRAVGESCYELVIDGERVEKRESE